MAAVIRRLAGVRAMIIDLRRHRGGDESMASFVTSFFFATEPMAKERFTASPLPAVDASTVARVITAPLDVLVSSETSPLALAFADNLERLGRARVVGPCNPRIAAAPEAWSRASGKNSFDRINMMDVMNAPFDHRPSC